MKTQINTFLVSDVEGFDALAELEFDLHNSWNHFKHGIYAERSASILVK